MTEPEYQPTDIDVLFHLGAATCIDEGNFDLGQAIARIEGVIPSTEQSEAIDRHLAACPACQAFAEAYAEEWAKTSKDDDTDDARPASRDAPAALPEAANDPGPRPRWRRFAPAVGAIAASALVAYVVTREATPPPGAPLLVDARGQIALNMGDAAPPIPVDAPSIGEFARTGQLTMSVQKADEDSELYAFTLDARGRLQPLEAQYVQRKAEWTGIRIKAPIAALFDRAPKHHIVVCATREDAGALDDRTLADVASDASCLVREVEVKDATP